MKTLLFFLVIGFSLCTAGKAQTSLVSTREKFRHHEISVSYGFLPITDANSIAEEFIAPTASFGIYTREKTSYYGALNISYIYRINRKISLGVTGGITGNRGTASSLYEVLDENKNDDRRYLYILPTFRWHWFTAPNSPYIPLQGSAPISSGTALEETLITKRNLPISSVFWVSNMEISLPSSPNSA